MPELILHHYSTSPFSEKVRLVLGFKGLAWKSVFVPTMLPKPDVVALTGGYRRTPFLQIGADIYCDTALMCRVIDRFAPAPALFPAEAGGMQHMIAHWADTALFWSAIPYTMQPAGVQHLFANAPPEALKLFAADRAAMTAGLRRATIADSGAVLRTALAWLEQQLSEGRPFLCADVASIADFSAVQSIWYIRRAPPVAGVLAPFERVTAWADRVLAFGHGSFEPLTSGEAIALSRGARETAPLEFDASQGLTQGQEVTVTATDYAQDPVVGRLVGLTDAEAAVERVDERAGRVVVHFPRIGYQVRRLDAAR